MKNYLIIALTFIQFYAFSQDKFVIQGDFIGGNNIETMLFYQGTKNASLISTDVFDSTYMYSLNLNADYFIVFTFNNVKYKIFMGVVHESDITLDIHFEYTEKPNAFIIYNEDNDEYDLHTFTNEETEELLSYLNKELKE
jgi:hypothetical protein